MPTADTSLPPSDIGETETAPASGGSRDDTRGVQDRISRLQQRHQRELEAARAEAVSSFRREHGIDDDALSALGASKVSDLHKALAATQERLRSFEQREAALLVEKRERAITDTMLAAIGDRLIDDETARAFVLGELRKGLEVDESGAVTHPDGDVKQVLLEQLTSKFAAFALPSAPKGGAGSRPPPSTVPPSGVRTVELLGEEVPDYSRADQARALVGWARSGK